MNNEIFKDICEIIKKDNLSQIPEIDQHILSQSPVNLMCVQPELTSKLESKLQEANEIQGMLSPAILKVAQMKLNFLLSKECVSLGTTDVPLNRLILFIEEAGCSPIIYTAVQVNSFIIFTYFSTIIQEYFVQIMVIFLKNCTHFQSLSSNSQTFLLR